MSLTRRYLLFVLFVVLAPLAFAQSAPEVEALKQAKDLYQQQKYKESVKLMKDTIKRYPNCSSCYVQLSSFYSRFGDMAEAASAADHAVKAANTDTLVAEARLNRCEMYAGEKDKKLLAAAEQDCREVLRLAPKTPEGHFDLGLILMRENHDDEGLKEIQAYVDGWPQAEFAKYARKILANPQAARQPMAPDFTVTCEGGKTINSTELAGKVVVIDFWATWCPACRAALPEMKELIKKYPSDKLLVISSSADRDENAWRDYISKKEMTWPQVLDKNGSLSGSFDVHAFPTYIVIDGNGFIRKRIVGTDPQASLAYQLKAELKTVFESSVH